MHLTSAHLLYPITPAHGAGRGCGLSHLALPFPIAAEAHVSLEQPRSEGTGTANSLQAAHLGQEKDGEEEPGTRHQILRWEGKAASAAHVFGLLSVWWLCVFRAAGTAAACV